MTPEQQAAYIIAQSACMHAEIEGMRSANLAAAVNADLPPFKKEDFDALPARYGLDHNSVVSFFTGRG